MQTRGHVPFSMFSCLFSLFVPWGGGRDYLYFRVGAAAKLLVDECYDLGFFGFSDFTQIFGMCPLCFSFRQVGQLVDGSTG